MPFRLRSRSKIPPQILVQISWLSPEVCKHELSGQLQPASDVNKDWACKDKDQAYNDKDLTHKEDKDFTYSYLLQVAAKPTIVIKQQQWTQSENSQHMIVKPIILNK